MTSRIISYWAEGARSGSAEDWQRCQNVLHQTAQEAGKVDESDMWNLNRLKNTIFYRENIDILEQPRGAGYWLWKPFIILETLRSMAPGSFVIYHDVGKPEQDKHKTIRFFRDIRPGFSFVSDNGGIFPGPYIPVYGSNKRWIKRDCFVLMDCDQPKYWDHCQIQATYNIWQVRPEVIEFVEEWLEICKDPRVLTDIDNTQGKDNFPEFVGHRHDQSVLTNLCLKRGIASLGSPNETIFRHRNLNFFVNAYEESLKTS